MLKQRVLTALVLVPLVIGGIFYLPNLYFALGLAVFVLIGAWEWTKLVGLTPVPASGFVLLTACILALLLYSAPINHWLVLLPAGLWWLLALWLIIAYRGEQQRFDKPMLQSLAGLLVLVPSWYALVQIHSIVDYGSWWVMSLMFIIWSADSGAYFAGRALGRNKLAPFVSPGKSWEGVIGGLLLSLLVAFVAARELGLDNGQQLQFLFATVIIVFVSVEGDLLESLYKRRAGMKDSGRIFPGHGGVLDRIDSLTAAAPFFLAALILLGIY